MNSLKTAPFWHFESLDSTNDFLKAKSKEGDLLEGTAVIADFQLKGKGQKGRKWESAEGENLLFSMYLRPTRKGNPYVINMMVALAVRRLVQAMVPKVEVSIKWPNDIVVDGKKIAGILIENAVSTAGSLKSYIGVGLNVNQEVFPEFERRATSLKKISGENFELKDIGKMLQGEIWRRYQLGKWSEELKRYNLHLYGKNDPFVFEDVAGNNLHVRTFEVNSDGQLAVIFEDGKQQLINHGEIRYRI